MPAQNVDRPHIAVQVAMTPGGCKLREATNPFMKGANMDAKSDAIRMVEEKSDTERDMAEAKNTTKGKRKRVVEFTILLERIKTRRVDVLMLLGGGGGGGGGRGDCGGGGGEGEGDEKFAILPKKSLAAV